MENCPFCNEKLSENEAVAETHFVSCQNYARKMKEDAKRFKPGDRVVVLAPEDPLIKYLLMTDGATGEVIRIRNGKVRVSIDDSSSQDTEGHNSYSDFLPEQVERLAFPETKPERKRGVTVEHHDVPLATRMVVGHLVDKKEELEADLEKAKRALLNLKGIYMRRWGTEEKCIEMTPNHEFLIIRDTLAALEK